MLLKTLPQAQVQVQSAADYFIIYCFDWIKQ